VTEPAGLGKLGKFKPRAAAAPGEREPELEDVRPIAEAHGFVDRDAPRPRRRRRDAVDEPTTQFSARVSVASLERFVAFCDRERYSYRVGFDRLIELLDQAERGGQGG
jgi:hypothetical protein